MVAIWLIHLQSQVMSRRSSLLASAIAPMICMYRTLGRPQELFSVTGLVDVLKPLTFNDLCKQIQNLACTDLKGSKPV